MLERTTGCLDPSNLRRLVPRSRKLLRSQRMLHSLFWNHGAADFELSLIWPTIFKAPDTINRDEIRGERSDGVLSSGPFLDFLYPLGALQFSRQWLSYVIDRQDGRRPKRVHICAIQRPFTSIAGDPTVDLESIAESEKQSTLGHNDTTVLERQLNSGGNHYDKVWRLFQALGSSSRQTMASKVMKYLSPSVHRNHARYVVECFHLLKPLQAKVAEYDAVVRAYATLQQFPNALSAYEECLRVCNSPVAADFLLKEFLVASQWDSALDLWTSYMRYQKQHGKSWDCILRPLQAHPSFQILVLQLFNMIQFPSEESTYAITEPTWDEFLLFTSTLINGALVPPNQNSKFEPAIFQKLMAQLRYWNIDSATIYEDSIEKLIAIRQNTLAAQVFEEYRRETTMDISGSCLLAVLQLALHLRKPGLAEVVREAWLGSYGKLSPSIYERLMQIHAAAGNSVAVHKLFDEYTVTDGGEVTLDILNHILHAHAVRGELEKTIQIFDEMEQTYRLAPNILCWNTLLSAYTRVGDIDGAFDRFEQLLASPVPPTHQTFRIMVGICIDRGDLEQAIDLFKFAEIQGIRPDLGMISYLVLGYCRERRFAEAERLCLDSLKLSGEGSLTLMWNHLLFGLGIQRDISNVNRILQIMRDAHVKFDTFTYSAMMETLCMVGQPDLASEILWDVMPETGIKITDSHCAIVLAGFLKNNQSDQVFHMYTRMQNRLSVELKDKRTKLILMKAAATIDQQRLKNGKDVLLETAESFFREAYASQAAASTNDNPSLDGIDGELLASQIEYLIFIYGHREAYERVRELYAIYQENVQGHSLRILSAMMVAEYKHGNHDEVMRYWNLALEQAKKDASPVRYPRAGAGKAVLPFHRYDLTKHLSTLMLSLSAQGRWSLLDKTIAHMTSVGFRLDRKNYNLHVQLLAQAHKTKQAFEICETVLMKGWTGWARIRWTLPTRNQLPIELRNQKKDLSFQRPVSRTLIFLAKAFVDLKALAVEVKAAQEMLHDIETQCPVTVHAIQTMKRAGDELERSILGR